MHWSGYDDTALDIEVDPQCCRFGRRKSTFLFRRGSEVRASRRLVCVFITAGPITKLFASQCVFITAVPIIKGRGRVEDMCLRETTSRGQCGLVCPSRTSERGGEGDCVKEGGGGEGECEKERALGLLLCHSPRH